MPLSSKQRASMLVMFALAIAAIAPPASAEFAVSISVAPPPLPIYEQPVIAEDGFIWTPGYWAYGREGYFWVPGTWVQPPEVGLLWTPGYWGWGDGAYAWNAGYWGTEVGFYGGVNYGYGYAGRGYDGGYWQDRHFYYNTAVSHVNVTNVHNVYTQTVVHNMTVNRTSYNGGTGGIAARPTRRRASRGARVPPAADGRADAAAPGGKHESRLAGLGQPGPTFDRRDGTSRRVQRPRCRDGDPQWRGRAGARRRERADPAHDRRRVPGDTADHDRPAERRTPGCGRRVADVRATDDAHLRSPGGRADHPRGAAAVGGDPADRTGRRASAAATRAAASPVRKAGRVAERAAPAALRIVLSGRAGTRSRTRRAGRGRCADWPWA